MNRSVCLMSTLIVSALALAGCDEKSENTPVGAQNEPLSGDTVGDDTADNAPAAAGTTATGGTASPGGTMGATTTAAAGADAGETGAEADAEFQAAPGTKITGEAEFTELATGVRIEVEVENAPVGEKGIHIHEKGDCSDIPNKSMGDHFAPKGAKHGLPGAPERHLGDLGNITIDSEGKGKLDITVPGANLKPNDAMSFLGKALVLHESNDKGTGEAGDAGKPVACALIKAD